MQTLAMQRRPLTSTDLASAIREQRAFRIEATTPVAPGVREAIWRSFVCTLSGSRTKRACEVDSMPRGGIFASRRSFL